MPYCPNRLDFALKNTNAIGPRKPSARSAMLSGPPAPTTTPSGALPDELKSIDAQFALHLVKSLANTDITNSGNTSSTTTLTDSFNQNLDYGPTPIDRRHVFVSNIVYLPSFKGHGQRSGPYGDWEMAGILITRRTQPDHIWTER